MYKLFNNPYLSMPFYEADKGTGAGATGNEDDPSEDDPEDDPKDEGNKEDKKPEKTFTQAQVTRMMTKEKNQGKMAAFKELGIDPKDTKMVGMFKAFLESQKTDEEKNSAAASAEKAAREEAEQRAMIAEAKVEAMRLGAQPKYVDDIITLAVTKMKEDEELQDVIGELKTKYPAWFGGTEGEEDKSKSTGKRGTGSSIKSNAEKQKTGEEKSLGARLAASRKTQAKKSSYWSK